VFQWSSVLVLTCVFCLGSGPFPTHPSIRVLRSNTQHANVGNVRTGSANARTVNAGLAAYVDGTGKGLSTPPVLSARQLRHNDEMIESMDHPLPIPVLPGKPSIPTPAPAPTTISNDVGGQLQPQTAIAVQASDMGGSGSSSKENSPQYWRLGGLELVCSYG
jgi:hypothetical protein